MVKTQGVSHIGPAHERLNLPNQDAWCTYKGSDFNLIVMCDGMGSCQFAHIGSRQACSAVKMACKIFSKNSPEAPYEYLIRLIHGLWLTLIYPYDPDDCHTTCLFALQIKERIILAQIGDGSIAIKDEQGQISYPLGLQEKDFSNLTFGLGAKLHLNLWNCCDLPVSKVNAVFMASDGVADDLSTSGKIDFVKGLIEMMQFQPMSYYKKTVRNLLANWPVTGHTDDKTIVILSLDNEANIQQSLQHS